MAKTQPEIIPFLKWAGGKRWFIFQHKDLFPQQFGTFFEPFLGSAAVFFELKPKKAKLSDVNSDLINVYQVIKTDWNALRKQLVKHQRWHSTEYYYNVRAQVPRTPITRAAKFIYLNRTCWNGLYRVNRKGQFNVPIGTKSSVILGTDNFQELSTILKSATTDTMDFERAIDTAQENDFAFIDPPYTVKHNHNGFIKYNERLFSWEDQVRLRDSIARGLS